MLEFLHVDYSSLNEIHSEDLFRLRKETFYDRLNWKVSCNNDMEYDEFDNINSKYILGIFNGEIICSVRFISLKHENMINKNFNDYFNDVDLPLNGIDSSRFFVDKRRSKQYLGSSYPITLSLYVAMIDFLIKNGHDGFYTITSHSMIALLKRSAWHLKIIKVANISTDEKIYLIFLHSTKEDYARMHSALEAATCKLNLT